jgi:uroporphyrinogen III methyltransferase/synthase
VTLSGRTILLTRDPEQSRPFIEEARRLGANVLAFPTIRIAPPAAWDEADRGVANLKAYAAVAFTSANAVRSFCDRCEMLGIPVARLRAAVLFAVGPRTADEAKGRGLGVAAVPERFSAAELGMLVGTHDLKGKRLLLPQGNLARGELAACLRNLGVLVDTVEVYRTLPAAPEEAESLWQKLSGRAIDVVAFASPSAAASFAAVYPADRLGPLSGITAVAVIGSTTAQAVRELGWEPGIVARESTMAGMLNAIVTHFG